MSSVDLAILIVPLTVGLVGLPFFLFGLIGLIRLNNLKRKGLLVNALVLPRKNFSNRPTLTFPTPFGQMTVHYLYSGQAGYRVGGAGFHLSHQQGRFFQQDTIVPILYHPQNPRRILIVGDFVPILLFSIFLFLGFVFLMVGLVITPFLI